MGPRAGLDGRKTSSPPGFDPGSPARSQSLYRLSNRAHAVAGTMSKCSGKTVQLRVNCSNEILKQRARCTVKLFLYVHADLFYYSFPVQSCHLLFYFVNENINLEISVLIFKP